MSQLYYRPYAQILQTIEDVPYLGLFEYLVPGPVLRKVNEPPKIRLIGILIFIAILVAIGVVLGLIPVYISSNSSNSSSSSSSVTIDQFYVFGLGDSILYPVKNNSNGNNLISLFNQSGYINNSLIINLTILISDDLDKCFRELYKNNLVNMTKPVLKPKTSNNSGDFITPQVNISLQVDNSFQKSVDLIDKILENDFLSCLNKINNSYIQPNITIDTNVIVEVVKCVVTVGQPLDPRSCIFCYYKYNSKNCTNVPPNDYTTNKLIEHTTSISRETTQSSNLTLSLSSSTSTVMDSRNSTLPSNMSTKKQTSLDSSSTPLTSSLNPTISSSTKVQQNTTLQSSSPIVQTTETSKTVATATTLTTSTVSISFTSKDTTKTEKTSITESKITESSTTNEKLSSTLSIKSSNTVIQSTTTTNAQNAFVTYFPLNDQLEPLFMVGDMFSAEVTANSFTNALAFMDALKANAYLSIINDTLVTNSPFFPFFITVFTYLNCPFGPFLKDYEDVRFYAMSYNSTHMQVGIALKIKINENFTVQSPEQLQFVASTGLLSIPMEQISTNLPISISLNPKAILRQSFCYSSRPGHQVDTCATCVSPLDAKLNEIKCEVNSAAPQVNITQSINQILPKTNFTSNESTKPLTDLSVSGVKYASLLTSDQNIIKDVLNGSNSQRTVNSLQSIYQIIERQLSAKLKSFLGDVLSKVKVSFSFKRNSSLYPNSTELFLNTDFKFNSSKIGNDENSLFVFQRTLLSALTKTDFSAIFKPEDLGIQFLELNKIGAQFDLNVCYDESISNMAFCKSCQAILSNFTCKDSAQTKAFDDYFVITDAFLFEFNNSAQYYIAEKESDYLITQTLSSDDLLIRYVFAIQIKELLSSKLADVLDSVSAVHLYFPENKTSNNTTKKANIKFLLNINRNGSYHYLYQALVDQAFNSFNIKNFVWPFGKLTYNPKFNLTLMLCQDNCSVVCTSTARNIRQASCYCDSTRLKSSRKIETIIYDDNDGFESLLKNNVVLTPKTDEEYMLVKADIDTDQTDEETCIEIKQIVSDSQETFESTMSTDWSSFESTSEEPSSSYSTEETTEPLSNSNTTKRPLPATDTSKRVTTLSSTKSTTSFSYTTPKDINDLNICTLNTKYRVWLDVLDALYIDLPDSVNSTAYDYINEIFLSEIKKLISNPLEFVSTLGEDFLTGTYRIEAGKTMYLKLNFKFGSLEEKASFALQMLVINSLNGLKLSDLNIYGFTVKLNKHATLEQKYIFEVDPNSNIEKYQQLSSNLTPPYQFEWVNVD